MSLNFRFCQMVLASKLASHHKFIRYFNKIMICLQLHINRSQRYIFVINTLEMNFQDNIVLPLPHLKISKPSVNNFFSLKMQNKKSPKQSSYQSLFFMKFNAYLYLCNVFTSGKFWRFLLYQFKVIRLQKYKLRKQCDRQTWKNRKK